MRLLVTGGRGFRDRRFAWAKLDRIHGERGITLLIEGGATGWDRLCRAWAIANDVPYVTEEPRWDDLSVPNVVVRVRKDGTRYNAAAGGARNQRMIDLHSPDACLRGPGGEGTADCAGRCERAGVPVWTPRYDGGSR